MRQEKKAAREKEKKGKGGERETGSRERKKLNTNPSVRVLTGEPIK